LATALSRTSPEAVPKDPPINVLVIFGTVSLYGMERGVIESFDLLRPQVEPHFLISQTPRRLGLPVFDEIKRRKFSHSFLSDARGWERLGWPRSMSHGFKMFCGVLQANIDALRAARQNEMIYVPNLFAAFYSFLALVYFKAKRRRVLYHFHDLYMQRSRQLRVVSFFVSDFIHCSELGKKLLLDSNPFIATRRNHVVPYRTGSPRIQSSSDETEAFRGRLNLLFFGQVSAHKGVDMLIAAFREVSRKFEGAVLHIAGGCSPDDYQSLLAGILQEPEFKDRVKYWGYFEDIPRLLDIAYLHIHPSPPSRFMDTFPLAALEAMRFGVPTICFQSGGLPEMIVDGRTGIVCDEETVSGLASSIERLLGQPELRDQYSRAASLRYQQLYSELPVKNRWLEIFSDHQ
jgi:glycosyltransferase involved in cell wall biosynthesis